MATEVKRNNNRTLVILGVVLAVAAGGLTLFLAQRNGSGTGSSNVPTVKAVYAQVDIKKGTKIAPEMLVLKDVPADAVSATTPSDTTNVVNKFSSIDIVAGSQIQTGFLAADANAAQAASLAIQPLDIKDGNVALAIPTAGAGGSAELFSVGGLIQADDRIDILIDPKGDGTIRYGFQDVHVLRAGAAPVAGQAAAAIPPVYIVEMPRAQAEELTFLFTNRPAIAVKYVLRPRDQYKKGALPDGDPNVPQVADQPVNAEQFSKLFPSK